MLNDSGEDAQSRRNTCSISAVAVLNLTRNTHCLKGNIEERACQLALYIIENKATVRSAAQRFGISKSTVHTEVIN